MQSQQNEATKAQLAEAQAAAARLEGELSSLQAEYEAACRAKAELVKERGQLEKRVRCGAWQPRVFPALPGQQRSVRGLLCPVPAQLRSRCPISQRPLLGQFNLTAPSFALPCTDVCSLRLKPRSGGS